MSKGIPPEALRLFANDLEAYAKVCLKIRTKDAKVQSLKFNSEQRLLNAMLKDQFARTGRVRAIVLKARQIGMSTYTSARFFRKMHLFPNQQAVVIADQLDRAETLFGMYDRYANMLPQEIRPMVRYATKKRELFFDNPSDRHRSSAPGLASGITVETAMDTSAGRGSTTQLAHCSEIADWPNAIDVYISLMQAIPDLNSEVVLESTAKGVGNLFHQMWLAAEEGEGKFEGGNGFLAVFFPWWTHSEYTLKLRPAETRQVRESLDDLEGSYIEDGIEWRGERHRLSLGQIAWRRQTIREKLHGDERAFRQEYPATPDEAFLVSGAGFFDEDSLKRADQKTKSPLRRAYLVRSPGSGVMIRKSELGYLRIWEKPDDEGQYIIGADTSTGREVSAHEATFTDPNSERGGRDFSSADVIDVVRRRQVAQLHGRMAPEIFADQLALLGTLYSSNTLSGLRRPALIAVEANHSSGETVLRILQQERHYPQLYFGKAINRRFNKMGQRLGFMTTVETRMPMLDNLARALREQTLEIPNKDSIKEMYTFVRDESGKPQAQEGAHDDRVISLAITLFVMDSKSWEVPRHSDVTELASVAPSPTGMFTY